MKIIKKICLFIHNKYYRYLDYKALYYKQLFYSCENNFKIWGNCYIKNPTKIKIGNNVSLNDGCYLNGLGDIDIGNNVAVSAGAIIVSTGLDSDTLRYEKNTY